MRLLEIIFGQWLDDLPNIKALYNRGLSGLVTFLRSPNYRAGLVGDDASKSPGRLGVYGFRNRADHSYDRYSIANSLAIKEDRLWEILRAKANVRSSLVCRAPIRLRP